MAQGLTALRDRGHGPDEPEGVGEDKRIDATARLSLVGWSQPSMMTANLGPPVPEVPPPAAKPLRPQVQFLEGRVADALFLPTPCVALEEHVTWFPATPELVERALTLRKAPVRALILGGPTPRLLRLDPASEEDVPDAATRTHDMLRDWDELLHRLAG